jgi:hypothetical protein
MEAVRSQRPDNDHPSLGVPQRRTQAGPAETGRGGGQGESGESGSTDGQASGPARAPALGSNGGSALLPSPKKALEGVSDATGGLLDKVVSVPKKVTDGLTDQLDKVVDGSPLDRLTGQ